MLASLKPDPTLMQKLEDSAKKRRGRCSDTAERRGIGPLVGGADDRT